MRGAKAVPSIVAADMVVKGNLSTSGDLIVHGQIEGDVEVGKLTISDEARVRGEVVAEEITVLGEIKGRIRASVVNLRNTARISGDIIHRTISMEAGAIVDGLCRHVEEPRSYGDKSGNEPVPLLGPQRKPPAAVS